MDTEGCSGGSFLGLDPRADNDFARLGLDGRAMYEVSLLRKESRCFCEAASAGCLLAGFMAALPFELVGLDVGMLWLSMGVCQKHEKKGRGETAYCRKSFSHEREWSYFREAATAWVDT